MSSPQSGTGPECALWSGNPEWVPAPLTGFLVRGTPALRNRRDTDQDALREGRPRKKTQCGEMFAVQ